MTSMGQYTTTSNMVKKVMRNAVAVPRMAASQNLNSETLGLNPGLESSPP